MDIQLQYKPFIILYYASKSCIATTIIIKLIINQKINLSTLSRLLHFLMTSPPPQGARVNVRFRIYIRHFVLSYFIIWFIFVMHDKSVRIVRGNVFLQQIIALHVYT